MRVPFLAGLPAAAPDHEPQFPPSADTLLAGYIIEFFVRQGMNETDAIREVKGFPDWVLRPTANYAFEADRAMWEVRQSRHRLHTRSIWTTIGLPTALFVATLSFAFATLMPAWVHTGLNATAVAVALAGMFYAYPRRKDLQ